MKIKIIPVYVGNHEWSYDVIIGKKSYMEILEWFLPVFLKMH